MKKLNIYVIHGEKFNYKEEFYKPLLLSKIAEHNLILPRTERYREVYAKDLINKSDFIIVNLTNATFSVYLETKWAKKAEKDILFITKNNSKCSFLLNKYKKQALKYKTIEEEKEIIEQYIKQNLNNLSTEETDGTINLGSIN